ncbi:hypothetical protein FGO68_gene3121 [Halteria grandinella]|uniref:Uncharacterized protein n=1 Tax=Halteria grandinella TaxID=5974 RepID=A0A8J8T9P9_HALGN|nr:hypothetical protein FGO68_gene3121 [Halteria grandinella]
MRFLSWAASLFQLTSIISLLFQQVRSQTCFSTRFPQVFGGINDDTKFYSLDVDTSGNIVIGGSTKDTGVGTHFSPTDPIILFQNSMAQYKWGYLLGGANNMKLVSGVAFYNSNSEVWAVGEPGSYSDPTTIFKFNAASGAIIIKAKLGAGKFQLSGGDKSFGFENGDLELVGTLNYGWVYMRLNPSSLASRVSYKQTFTQSSLDGSGAIGIQQIASEISVVVGNIRQNSTQTFLALTFVARKSSWWLNSYIIQSMGIAQSGVNYWKFRTMSYTSSTIWVCVDNSAGSQSGIYAIPLNEESPINQALGKYYQLATGKYMQGPYQN